MMKTIKGKLFIYFSVFVVLFQVTAILIFLSSNQLMKQYDDSFQRFLLLNSISQKAGELYNETKIYLLEPNDDNERNYYEKKKEMVREKEALQTLFFANQMKSKNYIDLIETLILESELTVGFVLRGDIEQYTKHIEDVRKNTEYIQEVTLESIDEELTAYQAFYKNLQERNEYFIGFILFLFMTTILLALFFAIWFSRGITRPIAKLSNAAKKMAKGELYGPAVTIQTGDELQLLGDTFNTMQMNIHELVKEIKNQSELDQLVKDMELKQLQNQVNPHFLFNTLNTISKMAYLEDAEETERLIEAVAVLLRHSLGQIDKEVSLRDEIKVVEEYFHIQKTRFSERVQFIVDVDESCMGFSIPRLTLQPLVENAFIHGIEHREDGGKIVLKVYQTEKNIIIEINDDGGGFDQKRAHKILYDDVKKSEHIGHSTGIGLRNVKRRLQLFFQQEKVIEIESQKGKWTIVRLTLPKMSGGNFDENFNRR